MTSEEVQTLPRAIDWLRGAWTTLPTAPIRIHQGRTTGGRHTMQGGPEMVLAVAPEAVGTEYLGSPPFTHQFERILFAHPTDEFDVTESVMCGHPRLKSESTFDCPDCNGDGHYEHRVRRYRSPMSAALFRLSKAPAPSIGTPSPIEYIIALYLADWDLWKAAASLHLEPVSSDHERTIEAMFLLAVRQLYSRYSAGPVARVSYTELSDSQRNAEDAA